MSDRPDGIVDCAAYRDGYRAADLSLDDIAGALEHPDQFVWVGLHEPSEPLLDRIQAEFGLHELAVEDAHRAHQRPKLETYADSIFVVLRTAQVNDRRGIDFGETHFFLGARFLVTVRHGSSIAYTDVRARAESTPALLAQGPAFALYAVMDAIVDQYFPVITALEVSLDAIEEQIFAEQSSRATTAQIYRLKRELLDVKRGVSPLIDICNRLVRFDIALIPEDTRPYFRDIYDHAIRINEMMDTARELLTTALEANFSLISIAQNEVAKRFTGWAAIIAIPTMVAGIYGMNFTFMPELRWEWGYPVVLGVTFGLSAYLFFRFRRAGWL